VGNELPETDHVAGNRWICRAAIAAIGTSISLMIVLGILGPRAGMVTFPAAPPWPPWYLHTHMSPTLWSATLWLVELLGGAGLVFGLLAVRLGWRPRVQRLIAASALAVIALMLIPPIDNGDPTLYAAFGRIVVLGHSPYVMTPGQLRSSGDAVGANVASNYWAFPSRYGPVATVTEAAASEIAGDTTARTIFWLKVWNGLAYLTLVLALDRATRSDPARRTRAHLLWSINPLMLFAIMANGHNDVLAAAAGVSALLAVGRMGSVRSLLAGILLGLASAIKAQYVLFGAGLGWAARRNPRALTAMAVGAAAILIPSYLIAGRAAISATIGITAMSSTGPWLTAAKIFGLQYSANTLGLIASALLAVILLWRMPAGPPGRPAIRVALALSLGLVVLSPQQAAWYDAMVFPLLAIMPATRLDWITVARATALAAASQPFIIGSRPSLLTFVERISVVGSPSLLLVAIVVALLWLCVARTWNPAITAEIKAA
jgi:alpha-1,6-mannosyltransferase